MRSQTAHAGRAEARAEKRIPRNINVKEASGTWERGGQLEQNKDSCKKDTVVWDIGEVKE